MTADLPDRQRTPVSARALNMWLRDAQTRTGVGEKRIGWLLASTVAVAALQRALGADEEPLFLLKGGLFMEFHLGLDARVTKDVDALFRGGVERFESALDAAISEPWGPFTLQRTAIEEITGARRLAKPRRFDLKLLIKGTVWRRIKVEISFPEGDVSWTAEWEHFVATLAGEVEPLGTLADARYAWARVEDAYATSPYAQMRDEIFR